MLNQPWIINHSNNKTSHTIRIGFDIKSLGYKEHYPYLKKLYYVKPKFIKT
jgi:hypothetical protein